METTADEKIKILEHECENLKKMIHDILTVIGIDLKIRSDGMAIYSLAPPVQNKPVGYLTMACVKISALEKKMSENRIVTPNITMART